jgi:hypothetical protein
MKLCTWRLPATDVVMVPRLLMYVRISIVAFVLACTPREIKTGPGPVIAGSPVERQLGAAIDTFFAQHLAFRPGFGIDLGLHDEYDGKVPDRSPAAIAAEIERLHAAQARFEAIDPAVLTTRANVEREIVLAEIRKELFDLEVRRRPTRDPSYYLRGFSMNAYIVRNYAPATQRASAMLRACEAGPAYYRQAAANLEPVIPKAWLELSVKSSGGTIEFLKGDARKAFAPDDLDPALRVSLESCLDRLAEALGTFQASLKSRLPAATDEFRLGADTLVAMLRATEGLTVDIATLERVARADLDRNRAALAEAARAIDPTKDIATVIAEVSADKPAPDRVLEEASAQLDLLQAFIRARKIVSIPRPDVVTVRASPPFMRSNFAAFGGAGPLEQSALPSFYYIAPPDPAWPPAEQTAYLPSRSDLLFISAHEVFPGHFIQGMHQRASGSKILQAFETYTASEGWGHYVEEMMWDQGLGANDPRVHIGQLKNALLRNVRFLVALGYHAGTLTPEAATKMFAELAYADPGNARQQAMRGTVDPMFLGYTLGKLIIMELRTDWMRANPKASIGDFHDLFLTFGEAPLPVTRRVMLGAAAGPPLQGR